MYTCCVSDTHLACVGRERWTKWSACPLRSYLLVRKQKTQVNNRCKYGLSGGDDGFKKHWGPSVIGWSEKAFLSGWKYEWMRQMQRSPGDMQYRHMDGNYEVVRQGAAGCMWGAEDSPEVRSGVGTAVLALADSWAGWLSPCAWQSVELRQSSSSFWYSHFSACLSMSLFFGGSKKEESKVGSCCLCYLTSISRSPTPVSCFPSSSD